jgi:hypothetical protein
MLTALALSLAYAGFTALCLAMHRHHRQVWHRDASRQSRAVFRIAGVSCLALSLPVCVAVWGGAIGTVAWFGVLTLAGSALGFLLPYAPRAAAALGAVAPLILAASVIASSV